jgi:hypothetical protein
MERQGLLIVGDSNDLEPTLHLVFPKKPGIIRSCELCSGRRQRSGNPLVELTDLSFVLGHRSDREVREGSSTESCGVSSQQLEERGPAQSWKRAHWQARCMEVWKTSGLDDPSGSRPIDIPSELRRLEPEHERRPQSGTAKFA